MAGLGKLLGYAYNTESLSKALQTLSASDSLDFRALLQPDGTLADSTDESFYAVTSADSGYENGGGPADDGLGSAPVVVAVDQLLCELQSVAVEWRSLRQAKSCSCAMPFEHHSKKVCSPPSVCLLPTRWRSRVLQSVWLTHELDSCSCIVYSSGRRSAYSGPVR